MTEQIIFWALGAAVLGAAIVVITARNPIHSAIALVLCLFLLAGVFVLQKAHFLAVIEVMVYAGAVMVLFVFVIMLLNLSDEELGKAKRTVTQGIGVCAAVTVAAIAIWAVQPRADGAAVAPGAALRITTERLRAVSAGDESVFQIAAMGGQAPYRFELTPPQRFARLTETGELKIKTDGKQPLPPLNVVVADAKGARAVRPFMVPIVDDTFGTTAKIGALLFDKYVLPFEIVSLLLLAAIVGAVVMAKKKI